MREKVLKFGASRGLVGILTEPAPGGAAKPTVILLNSGILHHVGASRLYVQVARRLATSGHAAFRFDFSGIGDSESRKDTLGAADSAVVETREAMDLLAARRGNDRFILFGLCSGADMGFKVAGQDDRVVGLIQLDPFAYRTTGYFLRHYGPKLLSPKAWVRFVSARLAKRRDARAKSASGEESLEYVAAEYRRIFPPREQVEAQLRMLVDRGVQLLNIFSDGQGDHINHGAQYAKAFPALDFKGQLQVNYVPFAAHTFTDLSDQRRVIDTIASWAERTSPTMTPAPSVSTDKELAGVR
ncbi:MAG: serine aminopeptidase domain-containing protein [Gemmatimonadales bacterium]